MTQQVGIDPTAEVRDRIVQIPSATTLGERHLALHYAAAMWEGHGNVFENGPLLGGSTRALAMGMKFNENRDSGSLLYTYDWWNSHEALDVPTESVWQAVRALGEPLDALTGLRRAFEEEGTFLPVFRALHRREDYWDLVRPRVGYLPNHRGDVPPEGPDAVFRTPEREFSLAFIDGCKSWYGTKHWFRETASCWLPNADLMFQDFGHYTCFWIPMLVGTFRENFELVCYTDYTYVWRLKDALTAERIERDFPDEPTDLSRDDYDRVLGGLLVEALERGDRREVLLLQMQVAAAYAYIGLRDEAREILDRLLMQPEWIPMRDYLKAARVSPTYTPEGRIEL